MEWLVLFMFFLLVLLLYYRIYARYRKTYENKSVDTSNTRYCAKFQPFATSTYAKNCQKQFCIFLPFWLSKWPQNSKSTWSSQHNLWVPHHFYFIIFLYNHSQCLTNTFKLFFHFFILWFEVWILFLAKKIQSRWKCVDSYIRSTLSIFFHFYLNDYKVEELLSLSCKPTSTFELPNFVKGSKPCQTPPQTFEQSVLVVLKSGKGVKFWKNISGGVSPDTSYLCTKLEPSSSKLFFLPFKLSL